MPRFYVVGGRYTDTSFATVAPGTEETRLGPFDDYETARREWAARSWDSVDDATARYFIEQEDDRGEETYWVVGGEYTDTDFSRSANEDGEDWVGPFETYEAAREKWAELAWRSVDDAYVRWRVEKRFGAVPENTS